MSLMWQAILPRRAALTLFVLFTCTTICAADQTIHLDGTIVGPQFDGVGAVSGGGATSVLLKDYPGDYAPLEWFVPAAALTKRSSATCRQ
jgi:hypothetical protein